MSKYYFKYHKNKYQLAIPAQIDERTTNYMSNLDEIFNIVDEFLVKATDKKDIVKLKDIYEMVKSSEMYLNMNKEDKRKLNYKTFCSRSFFKSMLGKLLKKLKF